ncbi:hypothetical protein DVS28_b0559 (plasmid) [Euzebya pacifica]|uniref:Uncharacterized protein n=1 Tax=Euzebya pacifica TaxID=1608957 RepID=A0A346Y752_9ACTN|nr:hypothetical protein DVS28_b0559 [Euzebya pacifica]
MAVTVASTDPMCPTNIVAPDNVPQRIVDRVVAAKPKITYHDEWFTPCTKCDGTGHYAKPGYGTSMCFACKGATRTFTKDGRKAAKAAKEAAKATAVGDFVAELSADDELATIFTRVVDASVEAAEGNEYVVPETVHTHGGKPPFPQPAHDIVWKAMGTGRMPSEKAAGFLRKLMGEHDQKEAEKAAKGPAKPAPSGKVTDTYRVIKAEYRHNPYGPGGGTKMLLEHPKDGYRVWATCPAALDRTTYEPSDLTGCEIRLSLDLQPSDDDETFAFGKRPKPVAEGTEWDAVAPHVARAAKDAGVPPGMVRQIADGITDLASYKNPGEVNKITIAVIRGDHDTVQALLPPDSAAALLGQPG